MNTAQQRIVNAYMSSIYQMLAGDADPPAKVTFMVGSALDMTGRMQLATAARKLDSDIVFVGLDPSDGDHPKPVDLTLVFNCSDQVVVHPGCRLSSDRTTSRALIVSPFGLVCRLGAEDLEALSEKPVWIEDGIDYAAAVLQQMAHQLDGLAVS